MRISKTVSQQIMNPLSCGVAHACLIYSAHEIHQQTFSIRTRRVQSGAVYAGHSGKCPICALTSMMQSTSGGVDILFSLINASPQQKGDDFTPIEILQVKSPEGTRLYSLGGCHRYEAHKRLGKETIRAKVLDTPPVRVILPSQLEGWSKTHFHASLTERAQTIPRSQRIAKRSRSFLRPRCSAERAL